MSECSNVTVILLTWHRNNRCSFVARVIKKKKSEAGSFQQFSAKMVNIALYHRVGNDRPLTHGGPSLLTKVLTKVQYLI